MSLYMHSVWMNNVPDSALETVVDSLDELLEGFRSILPSAAFGKSFSMWPA